MKSIYDFTRLKSKLSVRMLRCLYRGKINLFHNSKPFFTEVMAFTTVHFFISMQHVAIFSRLERGARHSTSFSTGC
jgi:hypothetical protein